jgi:hypothetical protein
MITLQEIKNMNSTLDLNKTDLQIKAESLEKEINEKINELKQIHKLLLLAEIKKHVS